MGLSGGFNVGLLSLKIRIMVSESVYALIPHMGCGAGRWVKLRREKDAECQILEGLSASIYRDARQGGGAAR